MLVNKAKKKKPFVLPALILMLLFSFAGSVYASGTAVASIYPGISSATSGMVKATGYSGSFSVSSSGPAYYVQGYGYKNIDWWPDQNVASGVAYPGQTVYSSFSAVPNEYYYCKAYVQYNATSVYGEARLSVN